MMNMTDNVFHSFSNSNSHLCNDVFFHEMLLYRIFLNNLCIDTSTVSAGITEKGGLDAHQLGPQ